MDLIRSFMNANLEDFVKSYASTILPKYEETEDLSENEKQDEATPQKNEIVIEHKEYSQTESPLLLSPKSKSFTNKSVVESIISDITQIDLDDDNIPNEEHSNEDDRNNKMYGEYGKTDFDLSMDLLPAINMKLEHNHDADPRNDDYSMLLSEPADCQWKQLPNVVLHTSTSSTTIKSIANDSFLQNIAKEIELLDEELSSMGVIAENTPKLVTKPKIEQDNKTNNQALNQALHQDTACSSDIEHDEEEKMNILKPKETPFIPSTHQKDEDIHENQENEEEDEENIVIIKDKLSLLRKSLVFKKKTVAITPNEHKHADLCENIDISHISIKSDAKLTTKDPKSEVYFDACGDFHDEKHKNAYFDPLVSPIKKKSVKDDYNDAIYHEAASKIQKQWKRFQLKTLLVHTFNRYLMESISNKQAITITDLIASTTHEIVDHAEKLFAAVHQNHNNAAHHSHNLSIDNISYNQLHFYGSPALDWCAVYSMMESIVLRNVLYYKNSHIVKKIFDTQHILDDILSSNTPNTNADNSLIAQLSTQLIQLKTKLYQECWDSNAMNNLKPLNLFPKEVNILKSNHCTSKPQSPLKQIQNITSNILQFQNKAPNIEASHPQNKIRKTYNDNLNTTATAKPEFNDIRNRLSLLRKSFSKRKPGTKKARVSLRSSPKYSTSLRSSFNHVNHSMRTSQTQQHQIENIKQNNDDNNIDLNISRRKCNFETFDTMERPQTAPVVNIEDAWNQHAPSTFNLVPTKKPFLKRRERIKPIPKKVDWSHVKPKTVSRLSNNVRASRIASHNRGRYKPRAVNWKEKASSRVDCKWSSNAYKSTTQKRRKPKRLRKKANAFKDSYTNSTRNNDVLKDSNKNCTNKRNKDDEYLYYLKKGNKIGKISRNSATAQLHEGDGPMILKTKQNCNENMSHSSDDINSDYDQYVSDDICGSDSDNQLKELQQTFAAIEKAMKQRREQHN